MPTRIPDSALVTYSRFVTEYIHWWRSSGGSVRFTSVIVGFRRIPLTGSIDWSTSTNCSSGSSAQLCREATVIALVLWEEVSEVIVNSCTGGDFLLQRLLTQARRVLHLQNFRQELANSWAEPSPASNPIAKDILKLKRWKGRLKQWKTKVFGHRLHDAQQAL